MARGYVHHFPKPPRGMPGAPKDEHSPPRVAPKNPAGLPLEILPVYDKAKEKLPTIDGEDAEPDADPNIDH